MDVKEKLEKGYVQSRVIVEVAGKPKEYVEEALKQYIEKIRKNEDIEVLRQDVSPAKEIKDEHNQGLWGTFVELEMLTKGLDTLVGFCFDYMPSSVEIIAPEEFRLKGLHISGLLNDLQGKLHRVDMIVKQLNNENMFLKRNTQNLLRNLVNLLLLKSSLSVEQLSRFSGVETKELEKFLDIMIKENRIKKEGDEYSLVK